MTPSELKFQHQNAYPQSNFFDRDTMKFFGDTMKNYGVRKVMIITMYDTKGNYVSSGIKTECWELFRKRPVKANNTKSHYFVCNNYDLAFPATGTNIEYI